MDVVSEVLQKSALEAEKYKTTKVTKHLQLQFDIGMLLAEDINDFDANLLKRNRDDYFLSLTRDNTQLLLNEIWELPTERVEEAIVAKLPLQKTVLPRMKPVPKPKPLTKWQKFAKEKGIQKTKKSKLSWDDTLKKWIPLHGFKRVKSEKEKDWILEVPQNADPMEDQFAKKLEAKGERIAKNELQRLRNIAKARKIKIPRVGILNSDVSSAKDLQAAVTVAKASTASLGKFQSKLPKEKEARAVADITPGATRKRKLPPVSGIIEKRENLALVESVLNKKPKLDIEKAVSKYINNEPLGNMRENKTIDRQSFNKKGNAKKPKSGKGQRRGKISGGRKRR